MAFESVKERWEAFLTNIEAKFHEVLSEAEQTLPSLLDLTNCDTTIFVNAWQGLYSQAHDLIYKIEPTWSDKVENLFLKEGRSIDGHANMERFSAQVAAERDKGDRLFHKLSRELHAYKVRTYAAAAKKLLEKAKEIVGKTFLCSQCHATLPVQDNFFRSYYVTCAYCNKVNTFEPGTIARNVEHFALDALAEEASLTEYLNYFDMDAQRRKDFSVSEDDLLDAYQTYVEKFLKRRIEIIPDYASRFDADLNGKMQFLERYLQ